MQIIQWLGQIIYWSWQIDEIILVRSVRTQVEENNKILSSVDYGLGNGMCSCSSFIKI